VNRAWALLRLPVRALGSAGHAVATGWVRMANWVWAAWFTLRFVDEWTRFPAVAFRWPVRMRIKVRKARGARLVLRGRIILAPFIEVREPIGLILWGKSRMVVEDDFIVSDGVRIQVDQGAELLIKGGIKPGAWGLHSHTIVMVRKRVVIGRHTGVSFYGWVTDSDWHSVGGAGDQSDVVLGDRVWVSSYVRILKGARIGDDSIVAAGSTVLQGENPPRSLLAGTPARVVRKDIAPWT
jgi:acetyltransferase-like isoleucine patch superfamily enzyme